MVIRLVTHGDLLFLDFPPQLSVHPLSTGAAGGTELSRKI